MQIYVAKNQQKYGPYTLDDVKGLLASGEFAYTDLIWYEGLKGWVVIESVIPRTVPLTSVPLPPPSPSAPPPPPNYGAPPASAYGFQGTDIPAHSVPLAPVIEYAEFWRRLVALCIDWFLVYLGAFFMTGIFVGFLRIDSKTHQIIIQTVNLFTISIGFWIYYALMESSLKQATLGKMAMSIMVTDMSGNRLGFGRATGRHYAKFISWTLCFAGFIMAAFTERKQGLHDIIASTLVIKKNR